MKYYRDSGVFVQENLDEIRKMIYKICIQNNVTDVEDFLQDFYLRFITKDALKKYNPNESRVSTYLYNFIVYMIITRKRRNEYKVVKRQVINGNFPINSSDNQNDSFQFVLKTDVKYETMQTSNNVSDQIDGINFDFDMFEHYLKKHNRYYRLAHPIDDLDRMDLLTIFKMMRQGHTNRSIARYFGISDMWICLIQNDLKNSMERFGFVWNEKTGYKAKVYASPEESAEYRKQLEMFSEFDESEE